MPSTRSLLALFTAVCVWSGAHESLVVAGDAVGPYASQVDEQLAKLRSPLARERERAAEAIGFLRAYDAEGALAEALSDRSELVRRQAAMALAWCGGRASLGRLADALEDRDLWTRQAAHVSLANLTGMEFPFDAHAPAAERAARVRVWRTWCAAVPEGRPPADVLELLRSWTERRGGVSATVTSAYKGSGDVLVDGRLGPEFWQTKNVPFPQSCTIDLGKQRRIGEVVVHQYGPGFVLTDYELATSVDGEIFESVVRHQGATSVQLVIDFEPRICRFVRLTSHRSRNRLYPTTILEIDVGQVDRFAASSVEVATWKYERALRALGALGGVGASELVIDALGASPPVTPSLRPAVRAGLRSLGRLQEEAGFTYLRSLLANTFWARHAADALGDFGDRIAIADLMDAYRIYAKRLDGTDPTALPRDDKMGFPSEDRMLETPYCIAFALSRLVRDEPADRAALAALAPWLMANLPSDHDTFFLYEPEVGHRLTRYLLELSERRQEAVEHAFELLGQARRIARSDDASDWPSFEPGRMATWLPAVCTEKEDLPRLVALLEHDDGWVRLNAAKTLAWIGDRRAIEPLAKSLTEAKSEAEYGYSGTFKDEEYADPAPRWREGLLRALGLLGPHEHTALIARVASDEASVLEVRHAAVRALVDLGNPEALDALRSVARDHSFHSVRLVARDALRELGEDPGDSALGDFDQLPPAALVRAERKKGPLEGIVFIKGSNDIPNTKGTVEQADRWRQTYAVTDSGPAYRPGRNLFVLRPPRPDGELTPLTRFTGGYVAELELSWEGDHVLFTHRGEDDPWWHLYRIEVDGSGLQRLTSGPYHDVGPVYLPDGRIVFASTRGGIRDEYHGYPCTSLHVMNADGTDMRPIATNIGRDNEPAVLLDGRIVFSRLEVFYSRNKTELTLHAVGPDGVRDVVLYGPERRVYWRELDHGAPTPADGQEAPLTHRVLRMTQPQPMPDGRHIVVVTQGGLALVGPQREREEIITPDNRTRSYTTPFPLPDGRILCASTPKTPDRSKVDLGLYFFDPASQELELVYNDPASADFEARPLGPRARPRSLPGRSRHQGYSGRFVCASVFTTQEEGVALRGKLVRLIEGLPKVARHSTQTNPHEVWKNHGGTLARVLGTAPLAVDGSFYVEAPADRLLHFQVLDSDRRVLGNQKTWIYMRPGETKSCVGCHEKPGTAPPIARPIAAGLEPLDFLPRGDEFRYRAKAWFKGYLPAEIEERTRTVRAVNLLAR